MMIMIGCYSRVVTAVLRRRAVGDRQKSEAGPSTATATQVHVEPCSSQGKYSQNTTAQVPSVSYNVEVNNCSSVTHNTAGVALMSRVRRHQKQKEQERHVVITLGNIIVLFLICWGPFYFVFDISAWKPDLISAGLYTFCFWSTYLNSTLNPFVYNFSNKEFREAFKKILFCRCYK